MDCSYCILQAYLTKEELRIFSNWDHIAHEIIRRSGERPDHLFRLGTGEFTDSLYLDHMTAFTRFVTPFIQNTPNMVLEFKTKTANVANLLKLKSTDRIIVSFSLNSPSVVRTEEHGSASLQARLKAARRCQDKGFKIGFHFDPLIHHPGWRQGYAEVIDMMLHAVHPDNIIWISMGCLRFMPQLKEVIQERFPESRIVYDEFIPGNDGKLRYFHPIRVEMFSFVESTIRKYAPDVFTYLCMESSGIWRHSLSRTPHDSERLAQWLDQRALDFYPSLNLHKNSNSTALTEEDYDQ